MIRRHPNDPAYMSEPVCLDGSLPANSLRCGEDPNDVAQGFIAGNRAYAHLASRELPSEVAIALDTLRKYEESVAGEDRARQSQAKEAQRLQREELERELTEKEEAHWHFRLKMAFLGQEIIRRTNLDVPYSHYLAQATAAADFVMAEARKRPEGLSLSAAIIIGL